MKVDAIVILLLSSLPIFLQSPPHGESFTLYHFLLDHLDRTLVSHSNLHSSTCPIKHLLWLSVSCSSWDYTVQGSSLHKCGQKSCCSTLNAVVTTFLLDIFAFLSSSYTLEVHHYHWKFLEGRLSYLSTRLTNIHLIRVVKPSRTVLFHLFLYVILNSRAYLIVCYSSDISMLSNRT